MIDIIKSDLLESKHLLEQFTYDEQNLLGIKKAGELMTNALNNGRKIISCGNGGSMCDAMRFCRRIDRPLQGGQAIHKSHSYF